MNPRLTPEQIDEILAGAEHVDVPAEQLVAAAAEIRAVLLAASDDAAARITWPIERGEAPRREVDRVGRARVVRTALVAAALSLALLLSAAVAGALPDPVQERVAWVAQFFGLDLPEPALRPALDASTGSRELAGTRDPASDRRRTSSPTGTTGTTEGAPALPASGVAPTDSAPTTKPHGPAENNGKGPTEDSAKGPTENNGKSPTENPGNGKGPTENPGNGKGPTENNGKSPTENPGNGEGPTENSSTDG